MGVEYRQLSVEQAHSVSDLASRIKDIPSSSKPYVQRGIVEEVIRRQGGLAFGAYHEQSLAGFMIAQYIRTREDLFIAAFAVHPEHRRQGIMDGLWDYATSTALELFAPKQASGFAADLPVETEKYLLSKGCERDGIYWYKPFRFQRSAP